HDGRRLPLHVLESAGAVLRAPAHRRADGALMGLGNLAAGSELVVTRASGVSVWRTAWPVALAGLTLALTMYGVGEYVAPPLAQLAKREKTTSKLADVSFAGSSSAWVKDGNLILRVQTGEVDQSFGGV